MGADAGLLGVDSPACELAADLAAGLAAALFWLELTCPSTLWADARVGKASVGNARDHSSTVRRLCLQIKLNDLLVAVFRRWWNQLWGAFASIVWSVGRLSLMNSNLF